MPISSKLQGDNCYDVRAKENRSRFYDSSLSLTRLEPPKVFSHRAHMSFSSMQTKQVYTKYIYRSRKGKGKNKKDKLIISRCTRFAFISYFNRFKREKDRETPSFVQKIQASLVVINVYIVLFYLSFHTYSYAC